MNDWSGLSVCIIASGPSLTRADADYARLAAHRVIVINRSWEQCPRADVLYAADAAWWRGHSPTYGKFSGQRWVASRNDWGPAGVLPGLNVVKTVQGEAPPRGDTICEGANSGFQALSLAVMWGATRIVLLGYDMAPSDDGEVHWHPDHSGGLSNPDSRAFGVFHSAFNAVAPKLVAQGVDVINASRKSALTCFPRKGLMDALP